MKQPAIHKEPRWKLAKKVVETLWISASVKIRFQTSARCQSESVVDHRLWLQLVASGWDLKISRGFAMQNEKFVFSPWLSNKCIKKNTNMGAKNMVTETKVCSRLMLHATSSLSLIISPFVMLPTTESIHILDQRWQSSVSQAALNVSRLYSHSPAQSPGVKLGS